MFTSIHNHVYVFFVSVTTFSLSQTNVCLYGSGEHVGHYICTSTAVDFGLWISTLQTVSMEWIKSAKCGIVVLLFGWHPKGETSSAHDVFLKTHEYILHSAAQNLLCQYAR
jgi:hypothetical protein